MLLAALNFESERRPASATRGSQYVILFVALLLLFSITEVVEWRTNAEFHTLVELAATLVALFVGVLAFIRYRLSRESLMLFIAAGFVGTAALDGYHTLVTSQFVSPMLPSALPALIPWSWVTSRAFLSLFLWLSWLAWVREQRGDSRGISGATIGLAAAVLTVTTFLFFALFFHCPGRTIRSFSFTVRRSSVLRSFSASRRCRICGRAHGELRLSSTGS